MARFPEFRATRLSALLVLVLAGCTTSTARQGEAAPAQPPASAAWPTGYLDAASIPDSLALIPAPPADGSAGLALDQAVNREALALRGTPRFVQAGRDADLSFPAGAGHFACAVGVPIDTQHTPHLYRLLQRSLIDASAATKAAKHHYQRPRPFMVNGQPTCAPGDEAGLRKNGSYPSGHTSIGWAWALILSEIDPAHADAIQARGRSYSESRLVCNVHWQSDILEGRFTGAAAVARLHANPAFQADLAAARSEIAAARAQGLSPDRDCAAEAEALKTRPASAL